MFQHRLASLCCRVSMIYHSEYLLPKQPSSQSIAKIKNLFLRPYLNYCKDNKEKETAQVFWCLNVIFLFILHFDSVYLAIFMLKRPFFHLLSYHKHQNLRETIGLPSTLVTHNTPCHKLPLHLYYIISYHYYITPPPAPPAEIKISPHSTLNV